MSTKVYTQDNYSTRLTTPILTSSGTVSFTVQSAPLYSRGFIWIGNASNPEIAYFTRSGNTLTIAGPERKGNVSTHAAGVEVRIANAASILNRIERMMQTTFSYEITGNLTLNVFGGPYTLKGTAYDYEDTVFTMEDNRTTYIYLRFIDNTVTSSFQDGILDDINDNEHVEYGRLLLTVSTAAGAIVSVDEYRPRDFVDANSLSEGTNTVTPELALSYISTLDTDTIDTGATIAFHNPGDPVDKEGTIEALFNHAQEEGYIEPGFVGAKHSQVSPADTWTVTHNLNTTDVMLTFYDTNTPANIIEPDTVDFYANYVTVTWAGNSVAGTCIVGAPSGTNVASTGTTLEMTAGEAIGAAKQVRRGVSGRDAGLNNSYIPDPVTTTFDTVSSSKILYQTFKALKDTVTAIQLYAKKQDSGDTTALVIDIFATTTQVISSVTYHVPTGASLATVTIAHGSLSTSAAWVAGTFSSALTGLTPGNMYAIKVVGSGSELVDIGYGTDGITATNGFQYVSSLTPISGDYAYKALSGTLESEVTTKVYLASAFEAETGVVVGVTKLAVAKDATARIDTHIAGTYTGLDTSVEKYYLSDIPGEIDDTAGTNTIEAGIPVSTTTLIIR